MKADEIKLHFKKLNQQRLELGSKDIVKQLRDGNSLATSGTISLKTVQSNIAKGVSMYEKSLIEANETIKKMDTLDADLINQQEYSSLKSYTQSIPKKIAELRKIGGKVQDLVTELGSVSTI